MSLSQEHKTNFQTLLEAFENDDAALLDCQDRRTGEQVAVICAMNADGQGGYEMIPLAIMINENPYEFLDPPKLPAATPSAENEQSHEDSP